jgi:micrococcal nuclease
MELGAVFEVLFFLLAFLGGVEPSTTGSGNFTVSEVVDGDTVKVDGDRDVRLLGVDTPEVYGEVSPGEFGSDNSSCVDMWADRASGFAESRLSGERVSIVFYGEGSYGRSLGEVFVDNESFNELLLRNGYARVYRGEDFGQKGDWIELESEAKTRGVGVWSC